VTLTLGASFDAINDKTNYSDPANPSVEYDRDKDQINPKIGVAWSPAQDTTVRAAYFRVLKRPLITNQTLEPTQVAGFNQFYDDIDATDAKSYGIGIDQKFSKKLFVGAEYYHRDLSVPYEYQFIDMGTGVIQATETRQADWDERLARAYLYWMPHDQWAVSAEYLNERFNQSDRAYEFNLGTSSVETVRVPLGVRFYHSSGFSIMARATYFDQNGEFPAFDPGTGSIVFVSKDARFWLYDAAISYRFPGRYGMFQVGGKNLSDRKFEYYDTDYTNPAIQPKSFYYARLSLTF